MHFTFNTYFEDFPTRELELELLELDVRNLK